MKELDLINCWLGGHDITIAGFKELVENKKHVSVCEIGCGGGDNLIAIEKWCKRKNIGLSLTGIDIKKECIDFAKSRGKLENPDWITSDYRNVSFAKKPDIIFSSLFCHHFTFEQLTDQLEWMKINCSLGFFINDLQRNVVAYHSIKFLTRLFSRSYLVKNDAPLSVARGFHRNELEEICRGAQIPRVEIRWKWAFRYLVVFKHGR